MKKFFWIWLAVFVMSGCGTEKAADEHTNQGGTLEEVVVTINTETAVEPGQEIVLSATVTQGGEAVEDADEVIFEVWQSGYRENSEMIDGSHSEDGTYEAKTVLEEEGLYFIQAHTTARGLHTMPKQEITAGNPDPASIQPDDTDDSGSMHSNH